MESDDIRSTDLLGFPPILDASNGCSTESKTNSIKQLPSLRLDKPTE